MEWARTIFQVQEFLTKVNMLPGVTAGITKYQGLKGPSYKILNPYSFQWFNLVRGFVDIRFEAWNKI